MTIALVRHGETDWNRQGLVQGTTDIPLNDTGRAQAAEAAQRLGRRGWDRVVTSTLSRAHETGAIIADALGLPEPSTHPGLVERRYGVAEGMLFREYDVAFPVDTPVDGRESRDEVAARMVPTVLEIAAQHPGDSIIIVSHGGAIRSVLGVLAPETEFPPIRNLSAHTVRHRDGALELIAFDDRFDQFDQFDQFDLAPTP
jgi:probable phosphoglycerate mutase